MHTLPSLFMHYAFISITFFFCVPLLCIPQTLLHFFLLQRYHGKKKRKKRCGFAHTRQRTRPWTAQSICSTCVSGGGHDWRDVAAGMRFCQQENEVTIHVSVKPTASDSSPDFFFSSFFTTGMKKSSRGPYGSCNKLRKVL